jgi:hypothetical protein
VNHHPFGHIQQCDTAPDETKAELDIVTIEEEGLIKQRRMHERMMEHEAGTAEQRMSTPTWTRGGNRSGKVPIVRTRRHKAGRPVDRRCRNRWEIARHGATQNIDRALSQGGIAIDQQYVDIGHCSIDQLDGTINSSGKT